MAKRAGELGKDDAITLAASGWALAFVVRDLEVGAALIDRALVLNSNSAEAWYWGGWVKILLGAPEPALAFRNPPATSRLFIATVTAYSSSRSARTASGTRASDGIAACPRKYPFGTKVVIEGRTYECRDRLNRKYDDRFDIWKPTRTAARLFGKRQRFVAAVIPANPIFVLAGGPQVRLARY